MPYVAKSAHFDGETYLVCSALDAPPPDATPGKWATSFWINTVRPDVCVWRIDDAGTTPNYVYWYGQSSYAPPEKLNTLEFGTGLGVISIKVVVPRNVMTPWVHVLAAFDTDAGYAAIYLNGQKVKDDLGPWPDVPFFPAFDGLPLYVGRDVQIT
jgi:hypothetical protein